MPLVMDQDVTKYDQTPWITKNVERIYDWTYCGSSLFHEHDYTIRTCILQVTSMTVTNMAIRYVLAFRKYMLYTRGVSEQIVRGELT